MTLVPTSTPLLIRQLERLPTNPTAAVRVLWLADDPNSSSEDLADAVGTDPALTTRIMHMANSAYYGLSGRVPSSAFAITVLGFSAVRTLAAERPQALMIPFARNNLCLFSREAVGLTEGVRSKPGTVALCRSRVPS